VRRDTQDANWQVNGDVATFSVTNRQAYVWVPVPVSGNYEVRAHITFARAKGTTALLLPVNNEYCAVLDMRELRGGKSDPESPTAVVRLSGISPAPTAIGDTLFSAANEHAFYARVIAQGANAEVVIRCDDK